MKWAHFATLAVLGLGTAHCSPSRRPELHQRQADKCLDPSDNAYDVNLGEPKCPNPTLKDPNG